MTTTTDQAMDQIRAMGLTALDLRLLARDLLLSLGYGEDEVRGLLHGENVGDLDGVVAAAAESTGKRLLQLYGPDSTPRFRSQGSQGYGPWPPTERT